MIQEKYMDFVCASGLVAKRFVTITKSTDTVAYTAAGSKPDGITIGDESNLKISVQLIGNLNVSFWFDSLGVIAKGGEVEVGANGAGQAQSAGAIACYSKIAATAGSFGVGYNTEGIIGSAVGTPGTGVTAVEEAIGAWHKTTLSLSTGCVLPAIVGGTNLGVGVLIYTLPTGAKMVTDSYMSVALDESDGNITADTPIVGIGTVIAIGAVTDLVGTGTFEDINTGKATADCNGTATVQTAKTTDAVGGLAIETGDAHTIHFNAADGWAASGEAACPVAGTVTIFWQDMD
jgi:hypothetical protein